MVITVKVESEVIAEIRNALQIIMSNAQLTTSRNYCERTDTIIKQVKRIDKLLPPVKFEE